MEGMMTKTLYISHPEFNVIEIDTNSVLLSDINTELSHHTYNTSIGDIKPRELINLAKQFDCIIFIDELFDRTSPTYYETIIAMNYISRYKSIKNHNRPDPENFLLDQSVKEQQDAPTLWIFGDSEYSDNGLNYDEKPFYSILGDKLGYKVKSFSLTVVSNHSLLCHLMNTNFRKDDIVIWALTNPETISMYNHSVIDINVRENVETFDSEFFTDEYLFFYYFSTINLGSCYLKAKNIKTIMISAGIPQTNIHYHYKFKEELSKYSEMYHIDKDYIPIEDGVMTAEGHRILANELYQRLQIT